MSDILSKRLLYKRILIKMSGESFMSESNSIDTDKMTAIAHQLKDLQEMGLEIAIVTGGGNIFRGQEASKDLNRSTADYVGMLATIMNGIAFQNILENLGISTRVQSALNIHSIAEPFIKLRAIRHLEKKRILIFVSGTGNPYFTTDTAAVLRSMELNVDIMFKATKVDGIYDSDPLKNPQAKRYKKISYNDFLKNNLKIMDATAINLSQQENLPILVFNIFKAHNFKRSVTQTENVGTLIQKKESILFD